MLQFCCPINSCYIISVMFVLLLMLKNVISDEKYDLILMNDIASWEATL